MSGFRSYLAHHRWRLALAFSFTLLAVGAGPGAGPWLTGAIVDDLKSTRAPGAHLTLYVCLLVLAGAVSAASFIFMRRLAGGASRRVAYEVRRDIFARLTLLDPSYYQEMRTGDLMNRLTGDLSAVQEMLGFGLAQAVTTTFWMVITLSLMLKLSLRLGLVVLGVFPFVVLLLVVLLRVIARRYAKVQEDQSRIAARAQENFSGVRVVKGYAVEDRELADYQAANHVYRQDALRLARVEGPLWATVGFLMNCVFILTLSLGAHRLLEGHGFGGLTLGRFISFTAYLFQLSWPMLSIGLVSNIFQRGVVSWGRLAQVLQAVPRIADGPQTDPRITAVDGDITFEHVSLTLGGRALLEDIHVTFPAGRTTGITGRTGAGKTLLTALLTRMLEPTEGRILIGGRPLDTIPLAVLRKSMGVVPQEPFLFSDTIAHNIAFGLTASTELEDGKFPPVDQARVEWAAQVAGLASDVVAFPQKYETVIGERGVTLSGGQRQRTALARAVARSSPILVLDDAMSAVDTETEARILGGLKSIERGRTVLLIGHRVSTLRHAEQVLVLEQGRVVEQGTHAQLLALGGRYAELDRKQQLQQALESTVKAPRTPLPALGG